MKNKKGFTLVELVIVIAVIAILASVLLPTFAGILSRAKQNVAMQNAKNALHEFIGEKYPDQSQDCLIVLNDGTIFESVNGVVKICEEQEIPSNYVVSCEASTGVIYIPTTITYPIPFDTSDLEFCDKLFRSINQVTEWIEEMDNIQSDDIGKLFLNNVASLKNLNPDIKLRCGLEGVNLLDYGCIDYETPEQYSGCASSLGGNYFITDGLLPNGFGFSIDSWGGCGGATDFNENNDTHEYVMYGDYYVYVQFYGSYMYEIEMFTENPPSGCEVCE